MPAFGEGRIRDYSNSENKPNWCTVVEAISLENLVLTGIQTLFCYGWMQRHICHCVNDRLLSQVMQVS